MSNKTKESKNDSKKTEPSEADVKAQVEAQVEAQVQAKVQEKEEDMKDWKHLQGLLRHINHVQAGSQLLAERLFDIGDSSTARIIVQKTLGHDASKFVGIEWKHLRVGQENTEEFKIALNQHQLTNDHHPEYWEGIRQMPRISIAEMTCDWYARSIEFGTDLRNWVKGPACQKYEITTNTKCYKQIKQFVDILLDAPFK